MKGFKVPIVLLGQQLDGYPCIFQDDYKAAVNLTEQMVKTGKKFGYITVTDKDEAVGSENQVWRRFLEKIRSHWKVDV